MVHGSLINQVNFKMVKMKTSHIKRLTGHMYTEYDYIRCGPPSSLTGRVFHNILLFPVRRVGGYPLLGRRPPTSLYKHNIRRLVLADLSSVNHLVRWSCHRRTSPIFSTSKPSSCIFVCVNLSNRFLSCASLTDKV